PRRISRTGVVFEPGGDDLDESAAGDFGRQRTAVEEDGVGACRPVFGPVARRLDRLGPMSLEEVAQMLGDRRVGYERQAEFLQAQLGRALRVLATGDLGKEAV